MEVRKRRKKRKERLEVKSEDETENGKREKERGGFGKCILMHRAAL